MALKPHGRFEKFVLAAIVANFVVLVWSWLDQDHEHAFEVAHLCFLGAFAIEAGIRLHRLGWSPRKAWRDKWLVFDIVVIAIAIIPTASNMLVLQTIRSARLIHTARHVMHAASHLRLAHLFRMPER